MTAPHERPCPPFPTNPRRFHLIGCCGTGMGSLALLLKSRGFDVSGSDTAFYPPMSDVLERNNIKTMPGWNPDNISTLTKEDIVVVGNVCRKDNPEAVAALEHGIPSLSLPETLYHFFLKRAQHRVVVSGTHGKTTTSSLITCILNDCNRRPSFFIGGEVLAFGMGAKEQGEETFVIEGDEYDTAYFDKVPKFWHYAPNILNINNIEFDHADIYQNLDEILSVFSELVSRMNENEDIFFNADDPNIPKVLTHAKARLHSYGVTNKNADFVADNIIYHENGGSEFDIVHQGTVVSHIVSPLPGVHNVHNLLAAFATTRHLGLGTHEIEEAIHQFHGVRKRQELIAVAKGVTIYDDFAHHPSAVRETVRAIRQKHPSAKLWGIFEIKSNTSRRAVFQKDYPIALSACDEVILSAPWKKDNLPPEQLINIPQIVEDLKETGTPAHLIPAVDDIVSYLAEHCRPGDVVLGMSGSSFDGLHRKLAKKLENP